jgi:hypothetical protein
MPQFRRSALLTVALAVASPCLLQSAKAQETFNGYPCTVDCSGHQAGYDWAEQNGITDPSDCGGNSQSFIEGCEAFTEENGSEGGDSSNSDSGADDENDSSD